MEILPSTGKCRINDLAEWMGVGINTVINRLEKEKIPILKLSGYHEGWLIDLEDLKKRDG